MTWHIDIVPADGLNALLERIRIAGGTVACSMPGAGGVRVTWTTIPHESDREGCYPIAR